MKLLNNIEISVDRNVSSSISEAMALLEAETIMEMVQQRQRQVAGKIYF